MNFVFFSQKHSQFRGFSFQHVFKEIYSVALPGYCVWPLKHHLHTSYWLYAVKQTLHLVLLPQLLQLPQGTKGVNIHSLSSFKVGKCIMYVESQLRKRHQDGWISITQECTICLSGLWLEPQCYTDVKILGWATLEQRRTEASHSFLYKIVNLKVAVGRKEHLEQPCTATRRNHNQQYRTIGAITVTTTNFDSSHEQYQCGITSKQFKARLKDNTYP